MAATPLPVAGRAVAPHPGPGPARSRRLATAALASAGFTAPARPRVAPDDRARRADAPDLRAVPTAPARQLVPTWVYAAVAVIILAGGVLGIVALNALAAESSFYARGLEADISDLTLRHDDLVAAVATLSAPGRVRDVARTQLGLIVPEQPGFLTLGGNDLVPTTPKPPVRLGG